MLFFFLVPALVTGLSSIVAGLLIRKTKAPKYLRVFVTILTGLAIACAVSIQFLKSHQFLLTQPEALIFLDPFIILSFLFGLVAGTYLGLREYKSLKKN